VALYEGWPVLKGTTLYVGISILKVIYCKSGYELDTDLQTCKGNLLTDQIKGTYSLYINYNANTVVPLLSGQNSGELRYQHTKLSPSREATPHIRYCH
jgi:hypothetical protein